VLAVVGLVVTLVGSSPASTQGQERGAVRRQSNVAPAQNANAARQGRVLLDRFAQRAGRALRLDADQTRRLQRELQASREARARLTAQARVVRQELAQLVRESSTDEVRMARLLDESVRLEVQAAEVSADEQRRLAEFLSPTQRVRIMWLRQRMLQQALQPTDSLPRDPPRGLLDGN
jgi:uncharacterized membrane protein